MGEQPYRSNYKRNFYIYNTLLQPIVFHHNTNSLNKADYTHKRPLFYIQNLVFVF